MLVFVLRAEVAELADARDSKSRGVALHEGSIPSLGTSIQALMTNPHRNPENGLDSNLTAKQRTGGYGPGPVVGTYHLLFRGSGR